LSFSQSACEGSSEHAMIESRRIITLNDFILLAFLLFSFYAKAFLYLNLLFMDSRWLEILQLLDSSMVENIYSVLSQGLEIEKLHYQVDKDPVILERISDSQILLSLLNVMLAAK